MEERNLDGSAKFYVEEKRLYEVENNLNQQVLKEAEEFEEDEQGKLFHGEKPFTGIEIQYWNNGQKAREVRYINGLKEGISIGWFPSGAKKYENVYAENLLTKYKFWHENGQLKEEGENEFGICIWKKEWDEKGNLLKDFILTNNNSRFKQLQQLREIKSRQKSSKE